ncbi:hypothetical protein BU16DRAFT_529455, partial [Lophium mytilinum]
MSLPVLLTRMETEHEELFEAINDSKPKGERDKGYYACSSALDIETFDYLDPCVYIHTQSIFHSV